MHMSEQFRAGLKGECIWFRAGLEGECICLSSLGQA
jgi:hypothetical protein